MDIKEQMRLEEWLIDETRKIGEEIETIVPKNGHMSLIWWPGGHVDVEIGSADGRIIHAFSTEPGGMVFQL